MNKGWNIDDVADFTPWTSPPSPSISTIHSSPTTPATPLRKSREASPVAEWPIVHQLLPHQVPKTCRFWQRGTCRFGDTCRYVHGYLSSQSHNRRSSDSTERTVSTTNSPCSNPQSPLRHGMDDHVLVPRAGWVPKKEDVINIPLSNLSPEQKQIIWEVLKNPGKPPTTQPSNYQSSSLQSSNFQSYEAPNYQQNPQGSSPQTYSQALKGQEAYRLGGMASSCAPPVQGQQYAALPTFRGTMMAEQDSVWYVS
jgi:hypothetical protein